MIKVNNLVAKYGDSVVLDGITLHVQARETMVIMGQSGCGKSTLLKHLIGLMQPAEGEIIINGTNTVQMNEVQRRDFCRSIGMLFQSGALFNSMTVAQNVAFPVYEHHKIAKAVVDIMVKMKLDLVGLGDAGQKMPSELSGGMRKRAGLARAMILDPKIIFLDEPTSGLDPVIAAGIDELVLKIKKAFQTTMVVVSHDIDSGFKIADRIAIFQNGRIAQVGTPDEIRQSDDPYVQQFINREPPKEESEGEALLSFIKAGAQSR